MNLPALGGPAAALLFTTVVIVCGALRPGYSHLTQFMSELGETGGRHAGLMNYGAFVPTGLLFVAYAVGLFRALPRTRASVMGTLLLVVFGTGTSAAGLYSCDPGCPQPGSSPGAMMHQVVSSVAFVGGIAAPAVWASAFRDASGWRSLRAYSASTSVAALALLIAMGASVEGRVLTGLWQRLFIGVLFLWCAIVGMRAARRLPDPT